MKTFDIEKAKNGAEVCRIDGAPAKILDFDFNGNIIYKFKDEFGRWEAKKTDQEGNADNRIDDLYMAPTIGYTVLSKDDGPVLVADILYTTLEECKKYAHPISEDRFYCYAKVELLLDEEEGGVE